MKTYRGPIFLGLFLLTVCIISALSAKCVTILQAFSVLSARVLKAYWGAFSPAELFFCYYENASNIYSLQNSYKKVTIPMSSRGKY